MGSVDCASVSLRWAMVTAAAAVHPCVTVVLTVRWSRLTTTFVLALTDLAVASTVLGVPCEVRRPSLRLFQTRHLSLIQLVVACRL